MGTRSSAPDILKEEAATYDENLTSLLEKGEGRFVLIHGSEVGGIFDTESDAINQGFKSYGSVPFLVKQILREEEPIEFLSLNVGF
jgi:hypothetical protein